MMRRHRSLTATMIDFLNRINNQMGKMAFDAMERNMKDVVIFDLDGTLALIQHRTHYIKDGAPKRWREFYAACINDEPNLPVIESLKAHLRAGHRVMIVTGRSDEVRAETEQWLLTHVFNYSDGESGDYFDPSLILMREASDHTMDHELKRRWLNDGSIERKKVLCIYEDRERVVQMWRDEGMSCFQVAAGDF